MELTRIEERKKTRADRIELAAKQKLKEEELNDEMETVVMTKSIGSPNKGIGVNF